MQEKLSVQGGCLKILKAIHKELSVSKRDFLGLIHTGHSMALLGFLGIGAGLAVILGIPSPLHEILIVSVLIAAVYFVVEGVVLTIADAIRRRRAPEDRERPGESWPW